MKRKDQGRNEEEKHKKIKPNELPDSKPSNSSNYLFNNLSRDEWSLIIQYLNTGSILMFAMSSKANYEWVIGHVKNVICKYYVSDHVSLGSDKRRKDWSLINALRQVNSGLWVGDSNVNQIEIFLKEIAGRNGSIGELTTYLRCDLLNYKKLYNLLDIRKNTKPVQVETLSLNIAEFFNFHSSITATKTISAEPIGFDLKELELKLILTRPKLYKILSKTRNLESLVLDIQQEEFIPVGGGRGKGGKGRILTSVVDDLIDESGESFNETLIHVPKLNKLFNLHIENGFDYNMFVYELVALCPNLEYFSYTSNGSVDDTLIDFIAKMCPKLKMLSINSVASCGLAITERCLTNFLEKQSMIESIDLESVTLITGAIFKRLGDFPTLKYFRTQRSWNDGDTEEQEKDLYFGGKQNPNLEFIDIGPEYNFSDKSFEKLMLSIQSFAPNLQIWGEFGIQNLDSPRNISKYFTSSLTKIELNSDTLDLVALCPNLKEVAWNDEVEIPLNIGCNPSASLLEINHYGTNGFTAISQLLPNISALQCSSSPIIDYLIESSTTWPDLQHLILLFEIESTKIDSLISQRPNLFIEFKFCENPPIVPISAHAFYFQWLKRDNE